MGILCITLKYQISIIERFISGTEAAVISEYEFPLRELVKCTIINLVIHGPINVKCGSEFKFFCYSVRY